MRTIDADALKARIGELCINNYDLFSTEAYVRIIEVIDAQPTAEPKRGRWMFNEQINGYLWKCSNCKGNFDQQFSYCPHCGAEM